MKENSKNELPVVDELSEPEKKIQRQLDFLMSLNNQDIMIIIGALHHYVSYAQKEKKASAIDRPELADLVIARLREVAAGFQKDFL